MSGTFFGVFYVGWLLSHAIPLRNFYAVVESKFGPGAVILSGQNVKDGETVVGVPAKALRTGKEQG